MTRARSSTPILPAVTELRLVGFQPLFNETVSITFEEGINVIVGGNGQGKTTIMQALVFGLAGANEFESDKALRWDHRYFHGRVGKAELKAAHIEVAYTFGKSAHAVRRSLQGSTVTAYRKQSNEWITHQAQAEAAFERSVKQEGGFKSVDDFAFVVHRLLYLPETRRLIAWDYDAQLRFFMLMSPDIIDEETFRKARADLKLLDSHKRHTHVALEAVRKKLEAAKQEGTKTGKPPKPSAAAKNDAALAEELQGIQKERLRRQAEADRLKQDLSAVSEGIEALRESTEQREAVMILGGLRGIETERSLALQKLLEFATCPCCGTRQKGLQASAQKRVAAQQCMLCGSDEPTTIDGELETLRSQLAEKTRAQFATSSKLKAKTAQIDELLSKELRLQAELSASRSSSQTVLLTFLRADAPEEATPDFLAKQEKKLKAEEDHYARSIEDQTKRLETLYQEYVTSTQERHRLLRASYQTFASAFLGKTCTLEDSPPDDRLLSLSMFVPKFDGAVRSVATECSEAQRFFLDIAFRMAAIEMASTLSGHRASFFCETPETALDMAHVENVSTMFLSFAKKDHSILITANLQKEGLAADVMAPLGKAARKRRVLSLLEVGQLDDVLRDALPKLNRVVEKIRGE